MSRVVLVAGAVLAVTFGLVWLLGGLDPVQAWVLEQQRQVQNALAGAVRAIKGGQPGAIFGLLSVCFAYGFLHAAGPGHGKLVIGGYGMARRVPFGRLAGVALASSLAQAAVAVGLVYAVVALLGLGRSQAEGLAEEVMAPLGTLMVAGVGLWLVWRGVAALRAQGAQSSGSHHHHHHAHADHHDHAPHSHGAVCDTCGHAHGP
jgi:ABC-type nickel/cobalt efflux system permease component RcnA